MGLAPLQSDISDLDTYLQPSIFQPLRRVATKLTSNPKGMRSYPDLIWEIISVLTNLKSIWSCTYLYSSGRSSISNFGEDVNRFGVAVIHSAVKSALYTSRRRCIIRKHRGGAGRLGKPWKRLWACKEARCEGRAAVEEKSASSENVSVPLRLRSHPHLQERRLHRLPLCPWEGPSWCAGIWKHKNSVTVYIQCVTNSKAVFFS